MDSSSSTSPNAPIAGVHVIKVGGSWLLLPHAATELRRWLDSPAATPEATRVLLIGGGPVVDGLRVIDHVHRFAPEVMHAAAIDAMDSNARLLQGWLPRWRGTTQLAGVSGDGRPTDWLLAPGEWLRRSEPAAAGTRLAKGWDATSDSIAARIAEGLGGRRTLLKRRRPPRGLRRDLRSLARIGYVDQQLPAIARRLPGVEFVWPADPEPEGASCRT